MKSFLLYLHTVLLLSSCLSKNDKSIHYQNILDLTEIKSYKSSRLFRNEAYCYYVFQNIIDPKTITPELFKKYIKGGSLNLSFVDNYGAWLKTQSGTDCMKLVGSNFTKILKGPNKSYAIFLNESAIINDGKKLELTLEHELLHIAFSIYKDKRERIVKLWNSKTKEEKDIFMKKHHGYNFQNKNIVLKEFFAYTYESHIEKGLELLTE